ncbi:uncharacterized protein K02A2.6-like [Diaphorina citri]|uniref:RNA-directed DNA polymerase n=1 Tax=Diaphorina citri TaxID=121845 RepID=A0A3Q0JLR9_DIACI|nr:uncharacterized protein K02A2.6-like [Diaphorina citri]
MTSNIFGNIKGVNVYFDDIIAGADSELELLNILMEIVSVARSKNVKFNVDKIQYFVSEVNYLGMVFNEAGMKPDSDRVESIKNLKAPSNRKELQSILGLINYLRPFIPNLSDLLVPFKDLLKKNTIFFWNNIHEKQLVKIKDVICSLSLLHTFRYDKPIEIQADASQFALGCTLLQDKKPVFFASRNLSPSECNFAQVEKELLAICFAFKKFHNFLYGHANITVYTDHNPLISIIQKPLNAIPNNRLRRLRLKLAPYCFTIKYLPGKDMHVADLLSRNVQDCTVEDDETLVEMVHVVGTQLEFKDDSLSRYTSATVQDPILSQVLEFFSNGWPRSLGQDNQSELLHFFNVRNDIVCENNLVFFQNRLVIPKTERKHVLNLIHETHLNFDKSKLTVKKFFYWPGILSDLKNLIVSCPVCQRFQRSKIKDPLQSHDIFDIPFYKVGVDIAEHNQKAYLVLIDYYSRWIEVTTLKDKSTASVIIALKNIFARFGIPKILISDNVPFNSTEFIAFSREWDFKSQTISPHHSRSNGLSEKAVGIVKSLFVKANYTNQDIQLYLLNYRNSPVAGLEYSPAQLLMSKNLRSKLPIDGSHLYPNVIKDPQVIDKSNQYLNYNKNSLQKTETFCLDDEVLVQDIKSKIWERGTIIECLDNRSYLVKMHNSGKVYRRNVHFIKKFICSFLDDHLAAEDNVGSDTSCSNEDYNALINDTDTQSTLRPGLMPDSSVPNCFTPSSVIDSQVWLKKNTLAYLPGRGDF